MAWEGLSPPYSTIVADPPWPYEDRPTSHGPRVPMPYSTMSISDIADLAVQELAVPGAHLYLWTTQRFLWDARDIVIGWDFVPVQVLVWCKEPRSGFLGGRFSDTTEFILYARTRIHDQRIERAGVLIRQAREAAELSRNQLYQRVRPGKVTGLVERWEANACLPNERDWERLQEVLPLLRGVPRPEIPRAEWNGRITTTWFQWPRGAHSEKPAAFLDVVEQASPGPYVELFARQPRLGWDSWGWGYEQAVG